MAKIIHECCGSHGPRHLATCPVKKPRMRKNPRYRSAEKNRPDDRPRFENGKLVALAACRVYYDRFACLVMTPAQLAMFRFLLEHAEQIAQEREAEITANAPSQDQGD